MITLTPLAAKKVKTHLERRGKGHGIKVGVKTTGCSGLVYVLEFVDDPNEFDREFVSNNIRIFVDQKSLVYLDNLELDWKKDGLNEGFDFKNPNEKDRCGCGESFRV